jgi:hypothetical protein
MLMERSENCGGVTVLVSATVILAAPVLALVSPVSR